MKNETKAIGPLPATGDFEEPHVIPDTPFKVNKNSPHQQALAKTVGWDHLRRLEKIDSQETDMGRSPFSRVNPLSKLEVKPRPQPLSK